MGIQGLLPLLKSIMVPIHSKDLNGCSVAIDTYSWLHKGALSCSKDLCNAQPTSKHIDYCMHRVNLLRHYGVTPILVFDGGLLPMKSEQETKRARVGQTAVLLTLVLFDILLARKENLARAIEHESNGNNAAAYKCYQKAVDISPSVAYELIQVLKQENVGYVVAPYEADAQMTFLAVSKMVDAVVTEDSDLIAFGCPRIIYKMDKFGQGVEFRYSMLQQNSELNLTGFTKQMLLEMCILSGCDYLQSLPGMGLKKAHALVKKFKCHEKVIKHLKYSTVAVSPSYEESFKKAILTFQHQRVYDPTIEDIVHLSDLPDNVGDDLDFLEEVNNGAGLVVDRTYHLKDFKPEAIGFASLEAKRRFRAPRSAPTHPSPINETSRPVEHVTKEAAACKTDCSPASLLDSRYLAIASSPDDYVDNGVVTESPESLESPSDGLHGKKDTLGAERSSQDPSLQQSRHSTHKPCMTLHKEFEWKAASDVDEGETRIQNTKVTVRSSYFQQKLAKENDEENQNENLLGKEDVSTDKCENVNPDCENKSASVAGEVKTRIKNRKTMVSSYFPHKSVNESDQDNRQEKLLVKADLTTSTCENAIPESASSDDCCFNSSILKRKVAPVDSNQMVVLSL
ncbi:unnamed protein product [Camellia sinensis]